MVSSVSTGVAYPPRPRTKEDAIQTGIVLRGLEDANLWQQGWHAMFVTEQFGNAFFIAYAAEIGKDRATLTRVRWIASRFTPEIVNRFPGLAFAFYGVVAPLMDDDPETALDLLEKAFDTPGLRCEDFRNLVNPTAQDSAPVPPPFRAEGQFVLHTMPDQSTIIGVRVQGEKALWEHMTKQSPLFGQVVRLSLAHIPI